MTTKCQLCRHWRPYTEKDGFYGYGLCGVRPDQIDGKALLHFTAAWNDECRIQKFVPIVPVKEEA